MLTSPVNMEVLRMRSEPRKRSSAKIGTIQRRLAWPLRKDDTHKSRMYHFILFGAVKNRNDPHTPVAEAKRGPVV